MSPEEQYPSADDAAGTKALTVRECLVQARKRVDEGWTRSAYIEEEEGGKVVYVCAVGGIFFVDGLTNDDMDASFGAVLTDDVDGQWFVWLAENRLSEVAKESIALVNRVAARRHPEYDDERDRRNWSGALEWVNQSWVPPSGDPWDYSTIKAEVLAIYSEAIAEA